MRDELEEIQQKYGDAKTDPRRTLLEAAGEEVEYSADDFIVEEDNVVIVSRDGWVKRQKEVKDLATTRLREGDAVLAVLPGSTRATAVFFTNFGVAYTLPHHRRAGVHRLRRADPAAVQVQGRREGRGAFSLDPRVDERHRRATREGEAPPTHALAVTSDGYSLRFGLEPFVEPSTRAGRRYARPADGAEVVGVAIVHGDETLIAATRAGARHAVQGRRSELPVGPGPRRHPHQAQAEARTACSASSPRPATATC